MVIAGYQVHVSPDMPRMQLSIDVPVSDRMREETNAWMREFFGVDNMVPDDRMITCTAPGANWVLVNPRTYARLQTIKPKAERELTDEIMDGCLAIARRLMPAKTSRETAQLRASDIFGVRV